MQVAGVPRRFREKSFDVGDVRLNYVEGPDHGLPLLLIPSQMESWQGYKPVLEALSQSHRVFVVDPRGHGKSTHTPGEYSFERCGEDLEAFLREVIRLRPASAKGTYMRSVTLSTTMGPAIPVTRAEVLNISR